MGGSVGEQAEPGADVILGGGNVFWRSLVRSGLVCGVLLWCAVDGGGPQWTLCELAMLPCHSCPRRLLPCRAAACLRPVSLSVMQVDALVLSGSVN